MLPLYIDQVELFDNEKNEFIDIPSQYIEIEHSLQSISKWEAIWKKPYLSDEPKTFEEDISYIQCMTLPGFNIDAISLKYLSNENKEKINNYLNDKATATWFSEKEKKSSKKEVITSELIYYWMIESGIPFDCDTWNINRLLTLIRVCGVKMSGNKKMSKKDVMKQNQLLNAQRRARMNSRG